MSRMNWKLVGTLALLVALEVQTFRYGAAQNEAAMYQLSLEMARLRGL